MTDPVERAVAALQRRDDGPRAANHGLPRDHRDARSLGLHDLARRRRPAGQSRRVLARRAGAGIGHEYLISDYPLTHEVITAGRAARRLAARRRSRAVGGRAAREARLRVASDGLHAVRGQLLGARRGLRRGDSLRRRAGRDRELDRARGRPPAGTLRALALTPEVAPDAGAAQRPPEQLVLRAPLIRFGSPEAKRLRVAEDARRAVEGAPQLHARTMDVRPTAFKRRLLGCSPWPVRPLNRVTRSSARTVTSRSRPSCSSRPALRARGGFKCPHCRLFVPYERADVSPND